MTTTYNADIIALYEDTISQKGKKFPPGTWMDSANLTTIVKYLIEEKLKWSDYDIKKNYGGSFFKKHGLSNALPYFESVYDVLNRVYPDKFKPWELKSTPQGFWNDETAAEAIKWMFEKKLGWSDKHIKKYLTASTFRTYGLYGLLTGRFKGDLFEAMNVAYPGRFKFGDFELQYAHFAAEDTMSSMMRY